MPGILSSSTSTQWPTYVKLNASVNASRKSHRNMPCRGNIARIKSASGVASRVLRVSAFMQVHLQPVEDRAPPDAAVTRPQHPVSFVGEVQELRVDTHPLRRRKRLISFGKIDAIIELRMHDQHRRLPVADKIERRPLLVERAVRVGRTAELPVGEPQLLG